MKIALSALSRKAYPGDFMAAPSGSYLILPNSGCGRAMTCPCSRAGNSETAANLVPVCEPATSRPEDETSSSPSYATAGAGPASYDQFDVLRFHIDLLHAPMVAAFARRTVTTLLGRRDLPELQPFCRVFSELLIVCIFNDQRRPMPSVNWARAIWSVPDFSEDYAV